MKITIENTNPPETTLPKQPVNSPPPSDLAHKPGLHNKQPRRKIRKSGGGTVGVRLKKETGTPSGKRSTKPETPLLRWKFNEVDENNASCKAERSPPENGRKGGRRDKPAVSARKLGAGLWRMHTPEFQSSGGGHRLGFQSGVDHGGVLIHSHRKLHSAPIRDMVHSPRSVSGPVNGLLYKFDPSFQLSNPAMEGATKWDPVGWKPSDEADKILDNSKHRDKRGSAAPVISALEAEIKKARAKISELEAEKRSSQKKLDHFLHKLNEEKAAWRSREHEKVCAIIDDMKADLSREKKSRQRLEIVNSKLVSELADVKLAVKRYRQEWEKERKGRELIEEVCDELAKEIGDDKAEVEALKRESMAIQEEVEEERKMLQMAEVWREERVQMKLIDAKVMLEEKYSQMNSLISELETFLCSRSSTSDVNEMKKAEFLRQSASSVNIQDVKDISYEPPTTDDIFSVFEDINFGEPKERQIEPCPTYSPQSRASRIHTVSPEVNMFRKERDAPRHSNAYFSQSGELEEDASEWETVSHVEDRGSSYSPGASDPSVNKNSSVGNISGNEGDETPIAEINEVFSGPRQSTRKASSISRFWSSCPSNGGDNYKIISAEKMNGRLSNGRLSNGAVMSPDHGSAKDGVSPQDLVGEWSPDSGNPHITRAMKGCIEWPRTNQKGSLKSRLLEARLESQKVQLKHVLKQKI